MIVSAKAPAFGTDVLLHTTLRPDKEPSPAAIDAFFAWFESLGGDVSALEIVTVDGLRGVRAKRDIAKGDVLLFVPYAATLSVDVAKKSEIGQVIFHAAADDVSSHGYIATFILDNLRRPSFWGPYLRTLPADFSDHPLFFTDQEMGLMLGSFAFLLSSKYRRRMTDDFERINAALAEEERFDLEDFKWAWCCVLTRIRLELPSPAGPVKALLAMSDLFNHADQANTAWDDNGQGFLFRAAVNITASELLTDRYGTVGNHSLFATWGFRLAANPHDEMILLLADRPESTEGTNAPVVFNHMMTIRRTYGQAKTRAVFAYLRHLYRHPQSDPGSSPPPTSNAWIGPIDKANELAVLKSLGQACANRRIVFGLSLAGGEPIPDVASELSRHLRSAVIVRLEEVQLLEHYESLVSAATAFLEEPALASEDAWRTRIGDDDYFKAIRKLVA